MSDLKQLGDEFHRSGKPRAKTHTCPACGGEGAVMSADRQQANLDEWSAVLDSREEKLALLNQELLAEQGRLQNEGARCREWFWMGVCLCVAAILVMLWGAALIVTA